MKPWDFMGFPVIAMFHDTPSSEELALSLWQQMPARHVEPDTVTFSAVIAGTMRGYGGDG